MNAVVVAAIINAGAAVLAAVLGAWLNRRHRSRHDNTPPATTNQTPTTTEETSHNIKPDQRQTDLGTDRSLPRTPHVLDGPHQPSPSATRLINPVPESSTPTGNECTKTTTNNIEQPPTNPPAPQPKNPQTPPICGAN